jgi:carboxyl-terminal processing protease
VAALLASATLIGYGLSASANEDTAADRPPACQVPSPDTEPPKPAPTTVTTIGQVYYCVLDHYYSGPVLDPRSMLVPAFAALTQELQRRELDQPDAVLPALNGKKDHDWAAFSRIYQQINDKLPADPAIRQAVAEVTVEAMLGSLNDNHVQWQRAFQVNMTGIETSVTNGPDHVDPVAQAPLYVTKIAPGSPAADAGITPGDEIVSINGVPPYVNGVLVHGALDWIDQSPEGTPVTFVLHRPATDATFTLTVTAGPGHTDGTPASIESKLLAGDIAYVSLPGFGPNYADRVLAAIAKLGEQTTLRGVILDLRGNTGGNPVEVRRLLGAFAPGEVISYWCDVKGTCTPNRADDSVTLLNLPLVALTSRVCASACDAFASAVKTLHLGTLVGTRTAGIVAGAALGYWLGDGTALQLPETHEIDSNKQELNTIGVPPDYYAPRTSADLSTGRDPGLDKAVAVLG